ncbi:MAG: NPCBM/NEW2 domain-containing protein [Planctomycetaceae bacterium]|nr:NPCBM/NEW2 domain-containing protein [Planctomycetaceae bacterium]
MKHFIVTIIVCFGFVTLVNAETVFIDQLDLSKTSCGWNRTLARKSVDGNPLSIAGKKFERGVGHHAPGEIVVSLPGVDGSFTAMVGIDDEVGTNGHAEFLVSVDSKIVWRSGFMQGKQEAKLCEVPFTAADKQLRLTVDTGVEGYGHDHTDWADAKITFEQSNALAKVQTIKVAATIRGANGNVIDRTNEVDCEFAALEQELKTGIPENRAAQALRPESTFLPTDKDPVDVVLRRTKALLEHLKTIPGAPKFEEETKELNELDSQWSVVLGLRRINSKDAFAKVVALRERIALQNPLLDFSNILFIKRHYTPEPEKQGNHMVDQFFGFHAVSGGGLFVLENAFDPAKRKLVNLTEKSVVSNDQRLKGKTIDESWGFLAPELSFDGTKIMFAAADTTEPRHSYTWTENNCYHLFEINTDGTNLVQLTDGNWNDIDPCYLPSGRVAFISERRGGYGRCHARPCPSYTLHSMLPDGGDITMLSPHETNEWAPMVDRNGMIVYTRWDYVDRGFNQAHHPWITTPDGRNPRAIQGNYSESERSRPHFETSFRQVPDSQKLVGTAQGHHSQYFGSIILLDPNVPDDEEGGDPMKPIRRVTPEQPFPEVECASHRDASNYGQPFPINEDFYLVAYDPFSKMNKGHDNNFGIYLLDSFGNKILLYRDYEISCQCPIAMKPRQKPPVVLHQSLVGLPPNFVSYSETAEVPKTGVIGVTNVYDTNRPFPEGTEIKELRVVQVLPKTTWNANDPWIGYGAENGARKVLGTVPVEPDGSARFEVPVNVSVYFQALDANGVAVQTMRSATYVKPGETLTCLGCHEGRQRGTARPASFPTAFRSKKPSVIKPEMPGSNPFNYPTLVQTIWDKHCVDCHDKEADAGKTFRLGRGEMKTKLTKHFFESYVNLAPYVYTPSPKWNLKWKDPLPSHGGAHNPFTTSRTFPNQFGANASPLWQLLKKGHYDVTLSAQEQRAISLWLDNNADFYGAYEFETLEAQRDGKIVIPSLE